MVLAKDIETALWNKIIQLLEGDNWTVIYQYDGIDAGIDYNSYTLKKGAEEIKFEWTNWDEGEIKCTSDRLKEIEKLLGHTFKTIEALDGREPGSSEMPKSSG
jgi:hypothetical protein